MLLICLSICLLLIFNCILQTFSWKILLFWKNAVEPPPRTSENADFLWFLGLAHVSAKWSTSRHSHNSNTSQSVIFRLICRYREEAQYHEDLVVGHAHQHCKTRPNYFRFKREYYFAIARQLQPNLQNTIEILISDQTVRGQCVDCWFSIPIFRSISRTPTYWR